jgi:cyclophilin family peptidyl-prolyl cis-trans isomerase
MQQRFNVHAPARVVGATALAIVALAALTACGGGGGDSTPATVSSMSVAASKYGAPALVTISGTHLGNLSLQASGCKNITRLTAAPTASTDTTAYYSCTPSGAYSSSIVAVSNGATLSTQPLVVQPPIVTMTVSGGGGGSVNGQIVFNLRGNLAPITVDNFLAYVNAGFYNGTIFHRVVPGFVVQGGGYGAATSGTLPAPKATPYAPIALELGGGSNLQWTAAMARTADDNSATSQFFFNLVDNHTTLDKNANTDGYAVFADVTASAAVIQAIAAASPCPALLANGLPLGDGSCVPVPNVTITTATQTQ